jgi:hypothetical protein
MNRTLHLEGYEPNFAGLDSWAFHTRKAENARIEIAHFKGRLEEEYANQRARVPGAGRMIQLVLLKLASAHEAAADAEEALAWLS